MEDVAAVVGADSLDGAGGDVDAVVVAWQSEVVDLSWGGVPELGVECVDGVGTAWGERNGAGLVVFGDGGADFEAVDWFVNKPEVEDAELAKFGDPEAGVGE